MLQFDDATAGILERAYHGSDFRNRRRASFEALQAAPGEHVADIGCGNGLLTRDLALAVGTDGHVSGIDPSPEMRALAEDRLRDLDNVTLMSGTAEALPLADGQLDGAVSLQVFEYLETPLAGLEEASRVLRSGGRIVLGDMHFGTMTWFSRDPERMARMCASWRCHVADAALPETLPALMTKAEFEVNAIVPLTYVDTTLKPDGLARMMIILMENYAVAKDHLSADEARAWAEEQTELANEGRFFMSLTHFVFSARKR